VRNYTALANATINLTIRNLDNVYFSNYTFRTDNNGSFYSNCTFNSSAKQVNAPANASNYYIRAEYTDPNGNRSYSDVKIYVINKTVDIISVKSQKAIYKLSEQIKVTIKASRKVGDKYIDVANITINGTMRNSSKAKRFWIALIALQKTTENALFSLLPLQLMVILFWK